MVKFWNCREEDVTVLYNGLPGETGNWGNGRPARLEREQEDWGNGRPARLEREQENWGNGTTILYISRIEHPGKNHVRLIEAYGRLPRAEAEAHPLVIAGADWKDAETVHAAAAASPHAAFIRFTGFVPEDGMEELWGEAGFYVFPSLFEGFGLSLVEAMARGIPCACSNNGSLGEIAGDVAVTFDPESVDGIAAALHRLVTEPEQDREARIARGLEHVKRFSWKDHASGIVRLLEGVA
jgi:glycosyltransferase involved in cell wall biosynthesis